MIYRVLVLLFAIVLIAAGTERMCAEVSSDSVADILDDDVVIYVTEDVLLPPVPTLVKAPPLTDGIAPAPVLLRVFRPPRTVRV